MIPQGDDFTGDWLIECSGDLLLEAGLAEVKHHQALTLGQARFAEGGGAKLPLGISS